MGKINKEISGFLEKQGFVIVSTFDSRGGIHCAAKGIAGISTAGVVLLIDLYRKETFRNLLRNPSVSITAIDEHTFRGYTLKGTAKIVEREKLKKDIVKSWEDKIIKRISKRVVRDVKNGIKSSRHPEARFPAPQYLIEMSVEEVVDLAPSFS